MDAIDKEEAILRLNRILVASFTSVPSEKELRLTLEATKVLFPSLTTIDFERVFDEVSALIDVSMDTGILISSQGHIPWLESRRSEIDWKHWGAYNKLLINEGRLPIVIDKLDQTLDIIVDHMGNPADETQWARKGLVIGDVQSGKTGTYIGLMNKAIDAGYRYFILLTGNTESLRQQTQSRVDQGVLGRDSMLINRGTQHVKGREAIGVGRFLDSTSDVVSMTTMTSDFSKKSSESVDFRAGKETAVLFITKKNKTVLNRISAWLSTQVSGDQLLSAPLLLIDDEADYASINTRGEDEDPTAINAGIIKLLKHFSRSTYVGFTATPFANIFIDDEKDEDLFPKDFIYGLEAPSNYVGPSKIFGNDDVEKSTIIHTLDDAEPYFPIKHKSQHSVNSLPDSLTLAIQTFVLGNVIRDLRGQFSQPRAMLVNVSRFNHVQEQVFRLVSGEFASLRNTIRLHSKMYESGVPNEVLESLERVYKVEFSHIEYSWAEVLSELPNSVANIETRLANSKTDKRLEQDELSQENPPRLIAVGGDLLSRGLTLEGLMVSYFYRNTAASDTLMQMGRWFGYRTGYEDLCRLWITNDMSSAYAFVADALAELRVELVRMRNQKLTPEQYGLAVRNHPGTLLITARNKMRSAKVGSKNISLRGRSIESAKLSQNFEIADSNLEYASKLVQAAVDYSGMPEGNRLIWRNLPKSLIADFLDGFRAHDSMGPFQAGALGRFARNAGAEDLQNWDLVLMSGKGDPSKVGPIKVKATERKLGDGLDSSWLVSDQKARVAGRGDVAIPLTSEQKERVEKAFKKANPTKVYTNDTEYVYELERPALFIYPISAKSDYSGNLDPTGRILIAIKVAIPGNRNTDGLIPENDEITYTLNTVAQKFWFPEYGESDDDFDE